ncbi:hypothetical protein ACFOSC_10570 [Streptantibioticus rubrisoli]|uniref:Uncharacterized protein n=1 Tax=Streptantibioticus rubrisoli TaxID=1387313 RepID=A0ABT1PEJ7_9ACTN|nr:hypothetical protein [Streptantibioticus rubrisoli]MCQ4042750.1 hypothetical protein [Streptantibioticus rubrisoli]
MVKLKTASGDRPRRELPYRTSPPPKTWPDREDLDPSSADAYVCEFPPEEEGTKEAEGPDGGDK